MRDTVLGVRDQLYCSLCTPRTWLYSTRGTYCISVHVRQSTGHISDFSLASRATDNPQQCSERETRCAPGSRGNREPGGYGFTATVKYRAGTGATRREKNTVRKTLFGVYGATFDKYVPTWHTRRASRHWQRRERALSGARATPMAARSGQSESGHRILLLSRNTQ